MRVIGIKTALSKMLPLAGIRRHIGRQQDRAPGGATFSAPAPALRHAIRLIAIDPIDGPIPRLELRQVEGDPLLYARSCGVIVSECPEATQDAHKSPGSTAMDPSSSISPRTYLSFATRSKVALCFSKRSR